MSKNIQNILNKIPGSWMFLVVSIIAYIILFIFNENSFYISLENFNEIIVKILPIFVMIFILMALSNYFITEKFILKHLTDKGIKKWIFVIIGGILSSGPIYMWYPLLANLKKKGLSYGLIGCFLYNRAIKIPLIPVAILYFSWQYIFILMTVMVVISIIQGILINKFFLINNK